MGIIRINAKNFKKHKDLQIDPNGESFFLLGDSGEGKSTVIDIINIAFKRGKMPLNALTEGEEEGFISVVADADGLQYTIKRKYTKNKISDRFEIVDSNGGRHPNLDDVLAKILGPSFKNQYFDYHHYFNKTDSPIARFAYFVDTLGNDQIKENIATIKNTVNERKVIGSQRKVQQNYYDEHGGSFDIDNVETLIPYYREERLYTLANDAKKAYLNLNLKDAEELTIQKEIVENIIQQKAGHTKDIEEFEQGIISIDEQIKQLQAKKKSLKEDIKISKASLNDLDPDAENKLIGFVSELETLQVNNEKVLEEAETLFESELKVIQDFNSERKDFFTNFKTLKELLRLNKEWEEMTKSISDLKDQNAEIFKSNLPIPELSVGSDAQGNDIVLYNGREFSLENISTGESIQIAAKIQRALNPEGTSFIVIKNAQDLGSRIDQVLEECKNFGIQAIVEVTKRDTKFEVVIQDDAKGII